MFLSNEYIEKNRLSMAVFPIANGGELAALNCFVFLFISTQGSGIWSVDAMGHGGKFERTENL